MNNKLYIYIPTPNTVEKDGIFSPQLTSTQKLQHYAERAKSWKKKDILKFLESTFRGRSRSISVLTQVIPMDVKRKDLNAFQMSSDIFQLPSIQQLKKLNLVSAIYESKGGKQKFQKVSQINYDPIKWPEIDDGKWGFTGIRHYQLVLTKGFIPAKYCKKISGYQRPWNLKEIRKNIPQLFQKLFQFPQKKEVHKKLKNQKVLKNIEKNLVYHGTHQDLNILSGQYLKDALFVSPCKSIAQCFITNSQFLVDQLEEKLKCTILNNLNFSFPLWQKNPENLRDVKKSIEITVNIDQKFTPIIGEYQGYIYTIDFQKYKDKWFVDSVNKDSNLQLCISGKVKPKRKQKIKFSYVLKRSDSNIEKHGKAIILKDNIDPKDYENKRFIKDKVHVWRAVTGLELLHKQPNIQEQIRILKNYNRMSDKDKAVSDQKCKQINHGLNNYEVHNVCMMQWGGKAQKDINELIDEVNKRDNLKVKYIHLSRSKKPLEMQPRVPENAMKIEDQKIKRICFSTSIIQASGAIGLEHIMYVHTPDKQPKYVMTTKQIKEKVQDASNTGQVWILDEKVKTKVIGKIIVKNYYIDQRYWYVKWYTDKDGRNNCSYFNNYDFIEFKDINSVQSKSGKFVYYPLAKEDIQNGYIDKELEDDQKLFTNLKYCKSKKFVKIPIQFFQIQKQQKNYIIQKNRCYNFSFNQKDIRTKAQQSKFDKVYNELMKEF